MNCTMRLMQRLSRGSRHDARPEAIDDSFWLGGEAMIAPACLSDLRDADRLAADECADLTWLVI